MSLAWGAQLGLPGLLAIVGVSASIALLAGPERAGLAVVAPGMSFVDRGQQGGSGDWWMRRFRPVLSLGVAAGAWVLVGGLVGVAAAVLVGGWCWRAIGRAEPTSVLVGRRALASDLPILVRLIATGVRAGLAPAAATESAARALEGPAADRLLELAAPLHLGADPGEVWHRIAAEPGLGPLGAALLRSHDTGAAVGIVVERLALELARSERAATEERARRVGVQAAVPLGVCLLPAFLAIGIVPVVAGLAGALGW